VNSSQEKVVGCIDHSPSADYVAEYAAWASARLDVQLELLHLIDRSEDEGSVAADHSGAIGFDAQEQLLVTLVERDEARSKLAREKGRLLLHRLGEKAQALGVSSLDVKQRRGGLEETLKELESTTQLFVLGRRGESAALTKRDLGSNVEWVVRALKRPILTVNETFKAPERVLLAFDGSTVARRCVELVGSSPLFKGLYIHLLMAGEENSDRIKKLTAAETALKERGVDVVAHHTDGDPERSIAAALSEHSIDLLVMGAWAHSPLYSMIFGSKTSHILRSVRVPTLLVR
jgi:nucleotide-binding universal stress UspA family protein